MRRAGVLLSPVWLTGLVALATSAVLAGLGLGHVWLSPDTQYFLSASGLSASRLPVYGWVLRAVPNGALPWVQWAAFAGGAMLLVDAIARFGASRSAALAVGLALVWSNILLLWGNAELPEVLAHAALLVAMAAAVRVAGGWGGGWIGIGSASVTLSWALLPSLVPFVVVVPLMAAALMRHRRVVALCFGLACLLPMLAFSSVRLVRTGDFNIVSYGGYQMAGMAALMLTPQVLARLPTDSAATGAEILRRRTASEAAGEALAVPVNSEGKRSFVSTAVFYFDMLARTHDAVLNGDVRPEQRAGETWPAFSARMLRFAAATVLAAPADYMAWVAGATARMVGHALVLNPVFVAALLAAVCMAWQAPLPGAGKDGPVLTVLVAGYTIGSGALSVLITFPASRYIDSAAMLLAAVPWWFVLRRVAWVGGPVITGLRRPSG